MKKIVACILPVLFLMFCGCESKPAPGNASELTQYNWSVTLDGGGTITLTFDGDQAELNMTNGGEEETIAGRVIADEECFVIFDSRLRQNYAFSYVPRGKNLDLTFGENTVELHAETGNENISDK